MFQLIFSEVSCNLMLHTILAAGGITGIVIGAIGCLLMWLTGCGG